MKAFYETNTKFKIEEHFGDCPETEQHFHDLVEFYYLCSGKTGYFIDNTTYFAEKGDLIIIPPSTLHKAVAVKESRRKRRLIYLNKDYARMLSGEKLSFLDKVSFFSLPENSRIPQIMVELLKECGGSKSLALTNALLCEFLILLSREKENTDFSLKPSALSGVIFDVIMYINEHYGEEITLKETAERFFVNPSYLSRSFKKTTGFNFTTYLNKYRILKATKHLESADANITEISFACGFNSSNHFCKTFKTLMGVSPMQYRKQKNQEQLKGEQL